MRRPSKREALGSAVGLGALSLVAAWHGGGHSAAAPDPAPAASQASVPAVGTALVSLDGSCSLGWVAPFAPGMLPDTPDGYQQMRTAAAVYYPGYTADATNDTGSPVVVTSVTVVQSFPGGADEPPVSFSPDGGPKLLEPGQSVSLDGYFSNGRVLGGGQLFSPSPETFEAGSCSAQFVTGAP